MFDDNDWKNDIFPPYYFYKKNSWIWQRFKKCPLSIIDKRGNIGWINKATFNENDTVKFTDIFIFLFKKDFVKK